MKEKDTEDILPKKDEIKKENIDKDASNSKKKIVPSYQKKNEPVDKKAKKKADKKLIKSRITIILVILGVLLIGLAVFGIVSLINYNRYKPYKGFEENMKTYGFDKVYDNESASTGDSITKSEAIKMVLSAVFNTSDISGFAVQPEGEDNYENAIWVEYAKYRGVITDSDINKDNANDKAIYIEVIRYFANAKTKILEKELDPAVELKVKDIDKYKTDEQTAIEDMIANEIITINTKKIKGNKHIFKGQMNEIISNFVLKYNTITVNGEKVNINEDKMPQNKDEYPYTLSSVDKSLYEIDNYEFEEGKYANAKNTFSNKKDFYLQIEDRINIYFDTILNVDYNTIDANKIIKNLKSVMLYGVEREKVEKYVNYVKEHKIILKGKSKVNFPAVYFDGRNYRVRTTLELEYVSSDTNKNLFFGDDIESDTEYDTTNNKLILDVPMGESIDNISLSISNGSISNWIAGNVIYEL